MICPYCNSTIASGLAKCPSCGFTLSTDPWSRGQRGGVATQAPPSEMAVATRRANSNNLAVASLTLGIGSWVGFGPLAAIPAVITGHMARKEINRSPGAAPGEGMATAGLWLGYANLVATAIIIMFFGAVALAILASVFSGG